MTRARKPPPKPEHRTVGRAERATGAELASSDLAEAAKVHVRAAAALVDVAERNGDVDAGAKAVRAYLEVRQAYGLAGGRHEPLDPFAAFVAGLSVPSMGDTTHP